MGAGTTAGEGLAGTTLRTGAGLGAGAAGAGALELKEVETVFRMKGVS